MRDPVSTMYMYTVHATITTKQNEVSGKSTNARSNSRETTAQDDEFYKLTGGRDESAALNCRRKRWTFLCSLGRDAGRSPPKQAEDARPHALILQRTNAKRL